MFLKKGKPRNPWEPSTKAFNPPGFGLFETPTSASKEKVPGPPESGPKTN